MAISWKVDELRSTVQAQMAQIDRLDVVIDELSARAEAAEAEVARLRDSEIDAKVWKNRVDEAAGVINSLEAQLAAVRQALGGSENSDLVLLATKISEALSASERELEQARDYVDDAIGCANPIVPLVERIGLLVSMLAAGSTTTPAELDAVVDKCTVDALARRVEQLEIAIQADVIENLPKHFHVRPSSTNPGGPLVQRCRWTV